MSVKTRRTAVKQINDRRPEKATEDNYTAEKLIDIYEDDCYGLSHMRANLPKDVYKKVMAVLNSGKQMDHQTAGIVANGMKEWALRKGCTHYTHWFQPLTGIAAEKHDSFINIMPGDLTPTLEFTAAQLVKGEPDASSFPSGGIRNTAEARGYTLWDSTSPAFIWSGANGNVLSIPTAFCSWTGEALDLKTPLLRSMESISKEAVAMLALFGTKAKSVFPTLGVEQEFFMIDRGFLQARPDLIATGRALLGAKPSKGQELDDHYFATMNPRIMACMQEIEWRMWKLGMPLKTRHNEVAPAQYEFAPIFERTNVASDHNIVLMQVVKDVAAKHNLAALFHEKPFAGINGSGKHNNWSMSTDCGSNLLDPGDTPQKNLQFTIFLAAVIRAVDIHADILRVAVASTGNDHRLGANEAPPAIISIYLGELLDSVVKNLIAAADLYETPSQNEYMRLGVDHLPNLPRDATDRNRTSPFAFTGNKFEFRAVGSSQSVAWPNIILNTAVAESIKFLREEIERVAMKSSSSTLPPPSNYLRAAPKVVSDTLKKHYRVVFNGNGYSDEWVTEAKQRGLPIFRSTPEALAVLGEDKNTKLFEEMHVMSKSELISRQHILIEQYNKEIHIEAKTLANIAKTSIIPAAMTYQKRVSDIVSSLHSAPVKLPITRQQDHLTEVATHVEGLFEALNSLTTAIVEVPHDDESKASFHNQTRVVSAMEDVRREADLLETIVDDDLWPLAKFSEMLFMR